MRGNETSHHWSYGEIYQGEQHPYCSEREPDRIPKKKEKKEKKTGWFAKWLNRLSEINEENPPSCGDCGK